RWLARALDLGGHEIWHDTVALAGTQELSSGVAQLAPGVLPVGAGRFEIGRVGSAATHTAPFLVSFSDQWAITNYDQMISLLRYFERQDWVDKLRHAIPDQRPAVWQQFYKATDPVELTPENEALDGYFRRVQIANQRFREAGEPGWLTDRGEVFITLGERAESLRLAGRPWHAAETLLAAAAREPRLNATLVVEGAKAELHARRYDRARSLLVGQPWLEDYGDGDALAVLAEAEARLGLGMEAAGHYAAARARARGARAALLAVREGLAWEVAGARDSAAAAYAAARAAGLPAIDAWLRLRQARVTRDTAVAFRLLADLP